MAERKGTQSYHKDRNDLREKMKRITRSSRGFARKKQTTLDIYMNIKVRR